jgi:hypothetical protein
MAQLYWPETTNIARHSVAEVDDHHLSPSIRLSKTTYRKSAAVCTIDRSDEQTSKLLETSLTKDLEPAYDGLTALDEICLDKLIETDLISSNC